MVFIPGHIKLGENGLRLPQLPFSAVDQDHIRNLTFFDGFTITATQYLIHCRIVIARRDAGDIVATVFRTQRPVRIKDHARRHRLFAHRVADVKTFHSFYSWQLQHGCQRRQPLGNGRLLREFRGQRRGGIGPRQFQITRAIAAGFGLHINTTPRQFRKRIGQQRFVVQIEIQQDLARQRAHLAALEIELPDEGFYHFAQFSPSRHFREITAAAQHFPLADKEHMDTGHPGIKRNADHVQIVSRVGNELFLRHPAHGLDLIAYTRSLFERQMLTGFLHPRDQLS